MKRLLVLTALCLALLLTPAHAADTPATAATPAVDEFGVPLNAPPPVPPGYPDEQTAYAYFLAGTIEIVDIHKEIPLPEGVVETKDIEYGRNGDKPLLLNLWTPEKLDKPAPGLIFIHGGGWTSGHRNDYKYYCVRYAKRGYVVASISYRFAPEHKFPACVQDAKCAVRWMRANADKYRVNPDAIAVIGGSAGGYLSMMVGYSSDAPELEGNGGWPGVSSRVQAVVDLYGPSDIDCEKARTADVVVKFLGQPYDQDPKQFEKASPFRYVTKDDPPTLVFQGTIDALVPVEQSDLIVEKLKAAGVPVEYQKLEGWPHTMDIAVPVNQYCQYHMNKFFEKYLKK